MESDGEQPVAFYFYSVYQVVVLLLLLKNRAGSEPYCLT